jgi:perosamine synthetase
VACGIQPGDEVIVPDLTFVATANVVMHAGARPVFVDVQPDSLCMCPRSLERAITPRTKVIMPVHLYGHPADMQAINAIAGRHGITVIEDAAEAHGAEYRGRRVGSLSKCGVFSFYGNKIITSGEGGMITTDDAGLYERAKCLRDHAMSPTKRYWHEQIGYNYRMTNLQAALGVAQLERIEYLSRRRREIMAWYHEGLGGEPGFRLNRQAEGTLNAYWMVCLEVEGLNETRRAALMSKLRERQVDSRPYFYPISDMPMYTKADTPVAHRISPVGMNLPSFVDLTREEVEYVCEQVRDCARTVR